MKKFTNYILRLEMINVGVEVYLAALVTDILIPQGTKELALEFSVASDAEAAVAVVRCPLSEEQAGKIKEKLANVPEELVCFDYSDGMSVTSIVLRKMTEPENEIMLEILRKEWGVTCSIIDSLV